MKAVGNKINYFMPIDDKGPINNVTYYLDMFGNLVELPKYVKVKQVGLPYAISVNVDNMDDICTMHISEMETMLEKLKANLPNISDHDLKMKYTGYIEALEYIISFNSNIDPWADFISNIEEEYKYE